MEIDWKYIFNQFLVETKGSVTKAITLSNWHIGALNTLKISRPLLVPTYDRYLPLHLALEATYSVHQSVLGDRIGQTLNLKQIFEQAVIKLHAWDIAIQGFYLDTTVRYKQIFPFGHDPMHVGTIDLKITAYHTLSLNIGSDANLAVVKAEVDAMYLLLNNARDVQNGAKGATKDGSGLLKTAVENAMIMQYRNGAYVMDNLYADRKVVCNAIFDLETLRNHAQTEGEPIFSEPGIIAGGAHEPVPPLPPGITLNEQMVLAMFCTNLVGSDVFLTFYFSANATDGPQGYVLVNVMPGQRIERTLEEMGWIPANSYLIVLNNGTAVGNYKVELFEV